MVSDIVTRFAPSPTGLLHLGHAWSALQAFDFARANKGAFLLRMEDIDTGRCRSEFEDAIYRDLEWLGLEWEGPVLRQSERMELYAEAAGQLRERGLLYPCWCTRSDIAASISAPHGEEGPIYPGTCKGKPPRGDNAEHCWRLNSAQTCALTGDLFWQDGDAPPIKADLAIFGDIVLVRKDTPTSYHLSVTVDDAAQGVTHIVRGQDLLTATHVHRALQALLGFPNLHYHHHALISGEDGDRLAKRKASPTLADLRATGIDPKVLVDSLRQGKLPQGFSIQHG